MSEEEELLATELDVHMLALLRSDGKQATAIEWMKRAYNLMERASKQLRTPKVYAIPGSFGVPTYVLTPPKSLVLPPPGFKPPPPVWIGGNTVAYGDKYQNRSKPWTPKDTRRMILERERASKVSK
jgi:alkanesulfonate monooxygenase SsuD/methylene tetrahydromethanopterin reductase-like flavin-dependent oxidoreductase (luciferase family)